MNCSLWVEIEETLWQLPVDCITASGRKETVLGDCPFCYKACFSSVKFCTCLKVSAWQNKSFSSGCCQSSPWGKPSGRQQRKRTGASSIGRDREGLPTATKIPTEVCASTSFLSPVAFPYVTGCRHCLSGCKPLGESVLRCSLLVLIASWTIQRH